MMVVIMVMVVVVVVLEASLERDVEAYLLFLFRIKPGPPRGRLGHRPALSLEQVALYSVRDQLREDRVGEGIGRG